MLDFASVVAFWMSVPLLTIILKERGISAGGIGVFAAMPWIGLLVVSPFLPFLLRRLGLAWATLLGVVLGAGSLVLFVATSSLLVWYVLYFLQGVALAIRWVAGDTWLNGIVTDAIRNRIVGILEMIMCTAVGAGPALLVVVGTDGDVSFPVAAGIESLSLIPLLLIWRSSPKFHAEAGTAASSIPSFWSIPRMEPVAYLGLLMVGMVEGSNVALLPLYGLSYGFSADMSTTLSTMLQVGALGGALGVASFAARVDRRRAQLWAIGISAAMPFVMPLTLRLAPGLQIPSLWAVLMIWGAAQGVSFALAMVALGSRFSGLALARAVTLGMDSYTIGSLLGPIAIGKLVDQGGPDAHPLGLAVGTCLIFAVASFAVLGAKRVQAAVGD
jgi:MFS family permease